MNTYTLPAGRYVIGDPTHLLNEKHKEAYCDAKQRGPVYSAGDAKFVAFDTAFGDGLFPTLSSEFDQALIGVDSGTVGIVPLDLVSDDAFRDLSLTIELDTEFACSTQRDGAVLSFGPVVVVTDAKHRDNIADAHMALDNLAWTDDQERDAILSLLLAKVADMEFQRAKRCPACCTDDSHRHLDNALRARLDDVNPEHEAIEHPAHVDHKGCA